VRFWAGARRAAGHSEEIIRTSNLAALRRELAARPALRDLMAVAAIMVDGQAGTDITPLPDGSVVDVLPPFAGGAS
jgi:sulfur-carrier protein